VGYVVSLLCRSPRPITPDDIIEIFENEIDFIEDHGARFEPQSSAKADWDKLLVRYDGDQLIEITHGDEPLREGVIEETIDRHYLSGPLAERLRSSRTLISIRPHGDDRALWEVLSVVEHNLAREFDGVIIDHKSVCDAEFKVLAGQR
jgi:hypothetical protein